MEKLYLKGLFTLFLFGSLAGSGELSAQFNRDRSVLISATVTENPPAITLSWPKFTDATSLRVFRKSKDAKDWGTTYATLGLTDSMFKDTAVKTGEGYEYLIFKEGGSTLALGNVFAGINYKPADLHGVIGLVVDSTYLVPLASEIELLEHDLIGDGWQVHRLAIGRTESPKNVRDKIKAIKGLKSVFLLGNIPVPYSGNIFPDGHPDHKGAWPCDGYYADTNGFWFDMGVSNSGATRLENRNVPGDGKWDANTFEDDGVDIPIGRVDMTKLPVFAGQTDADLVKYYLQKNHDFRLGVLTAPRRALIDDNFQGYTIASSNWRNFAPMVGESNIVHNGQAGVDYYSTLKSEWYLWSGGAGAGSYNSCGGTINSNQFAVDSVKTIFTSLAGSYFGDWDSQNNLLRAALASKPGILASFWGGIPNWVLHHMGLGECIGYGAMLTQDEDGTLYEGNFNLSQNAVHIALMGDPTLRLHQVLPAGNFTADSSAIKKVTLNWTASADSEIIGYHIYRATHLYGQFGRVTQTPVAGTAFTDPDPFQGHNVYMIRAVKKETTPSGTYYNLSQGMFDSTDITFPVSIADLLKPLEILVYPNPAHSYLELEVKTPSQEPFTAEVTSLLGQTVGTYVMNESTLRINTGHLQPGIYFVRLSGEGYSGTVKFVKE